MSMRRRNNVSGQSTIVGSDLPTPRKGKATAKHKTTLPLSRISLSSSIYILCALALAFTAFQVWRIMWLKTAAGGWWNRRPTGSGGMDGSVEDHINGLAEALGIQSHVLASAIAKVVKSHVPSASLSYVAAPKATKSGTAFGILGTKGGAQEAQQPGVGAVDRPGAASI